MQDYGALYSTEKHNFGEVYQVFPVGSNWDGRRFHGYMSVPIEICEQLEAGIITMDAAIQILNK